MLELWFGAIVNKFDTLMDFTGGPQDGQDSTMYHIPFIGVGCSLGCSTNKLTNKPDHIRADKPQRPTTT